MNAASAVNSLRRFPAQLSSLVDSLEPELNSFKPESGNWSILEIVCHLGDEEEHDFPVRLRLILDGAETWSPIDPEGWATEKKYQQQDFQESLKRFLELRKQSLNWLNTLDLESTDWESHYDHPRFGRFKAGDMLFAWAAHDLLHIRQIGKRMYEFNNRSAGNYSTRYAGDL